MRKKHIAVLLGCLFASSAVSAQTQSVTMYGVIDTGYEYLNHATSSGGGLFRMPSISSSVPSRWGFRGQESLGGGIDAVFTLEGGFAPDMGGQMQNGRLFGRQSTLGVRGAWGQVDLGRQWSTTFRTILDADVIGPSAFSLASLDSYIPNSRVDNSISYYGTFSGLTLGAVYSLGRDTFSAGNCGGEQGNSDCTAWSAMVKYNAAQWGIAGGYDELRGGPGAAAITVVPGAPGVVFTSSDDKDQRYHLNGYFRIAKLKIAGGTIFRKIDAEARNLHTNLYYIGATMPYQNWTFDGQFSRMNNSSYDSDASLVVLRATYAFSKRTAAYVSAAYIDNSGDGPAYSVSASSFSVAAPKPGQSQIGTLVGVRHAF